MAKHYFLGMAGGYSRAERLRHTFCVGRQSDCDALTTYLGERYGGEAMLCKNGRSALALALKAYFEPGDKVIVNGFTCYAVYEAVKTAGLTPVWADISREDLNFDVDRLKNASGIIVQNTLGNPVDIAKVEKFAKEHEMVIIEDLAHSAGVRYADGREVGTVGMAAAFSFGKDKSIDTVSGGAVVLRDSYKHKIQAPNESPKPSDHMRARFYPLFGAMCRGLTRVHLGGALMRFLVKIHFVERSADNKLDVKRKISKFEAKLALKQFKELKKGGEPVLREFFLVRDRGEVLTRLRKAGYYFDGFWYERPVSPERYYKKVHFPEAECPEAVYVSEHIVNLPNYYSKQDLAEARKIIKEYMEVEDGK